MTINLLDIITKDRTLPDGCDMWAIRSCQPDLRSKHGYRWSWPGGWNEAPGPINAPNQGGCPSTPGDGICVAQSWQGMRSGDVDARILLLVAYDSADVLGTSPSEGKLRVSRCLSVDVVDGWRLVRKHGEGADLTGANLRGADLTGANLRFAYLTRADLTGADLRGADLTGAYLTGAYLRDADLTGAYLRGADLTGAYLRGADLGDANLRCAYLRDADLTGAYLGDADLRCADLTGAYLRDADLTGADLRGADLRGADLRCARVNRDTRWPQAFTPPADIVHVDQAA